MKNSNAALVSIIIPCYNQASFLAETLDSVLQQTYVNWECIIVNDGSSDNTEEIANIYCNKDPRFKYFHKTNGGLSSARNAGIQQSNGTYILPLDSDDKIGSEYLRLGVEILNSNDKIKIAYCKAELFGEKSCLWELPQYSFERILGGNVIFCSALYRRTDYDKTTGYNQNMIHGFEDWDFWLSILENGGDVFCIDKIMFYYRIRKESMLRSLDANKNEYLRKKIWKNHQRLYSENFLNPIYSFEYLLISKSLEYRLGSFILKPLFKLTLVISSLKKSFKSRGILIKKKHL
jgi:glycosyltransferase involved in cell wall biosynthesis